MPKPDSEGRIKEAVVLARLKGYEALRRMVVGDCPTRSHECMHIIDLGTDNILRVLDQEGVITLNDKERKRLQDEDKDIAESS